MARRAFVVLDGSGAVIRPCFANGLVQRASRFGPKTGGDGVIPRGDASFIDLVLSKF